MNDKNINKHLEELLTVFNPFSPTPEDSVLIKRDLQAFILQKLFRKKFRRLKLSQNTTEDITSKIGNSIKNRVPIYINILFGGYKHFWNPSHPEIDWAELFTLKFLTDYVAPIVSVYKPGVVIEFVSEDLIIPKMNNYPEEVLDIYTESFKKLLDKYSVCLPNNLKITYDRVGDMCDKHKILVEVEKKLPASWEKWATYTEEQKENEIKRSKRSILWPGKEDLTTLSADEKMKRTIESRLAELAYYEVESMPEFLGTYLGENNRIGVCFSWGLSSDNSEHWLTLGSTYASTVDFWIGRGIVGVGQEGNYINRIISKEQYEKIRGKLKLQKISPSLIPLTNFQSIETIVESDWFDVIQSPQ